MFKRITIFAFIFSIHFLFADSLAEDSLHLVLQEQSDEIADSIENAKDSLLLAAEDSDTEPESALDSVITEDSLNTLDSLNTINTAFLDFSDWTLPTTTGVRITSPYGIRRYRLHRGIDVKVYKGDSILSVAPGKVVKAAYERRGYGHYIIIEHTNGTKTLYGHLSKRLVKRGDSVNTASLIGLGGNTGRSTGSHLHFEIRYRDINISPHKIFDFPAGKLLDSLQTFSLEVARVDHEILAKELSKYRIYKVKKGDTLGKIARKYGISIQKLCRLNHIKRNSILRIGQRLRCS